MTLGEIQEKWGKEGNSGLYVKTRHAFEQSFRSLPKDTNCNELTLQVLRDAIRKSTTVKEFKVKAASTMVHMLEFAHKIAPSECKKPNFAYSDILFEPVVKKSVRERKAAAKKAEKVVEPKKEEPEGDDEAVELKNEEDMENEKTNRGRDKRRICKLDPMTFKPIETYESVKEACEKTKNKNIIRTIKEKRRTGGFYWCYEDDVESFNLNKKPEVVVGIDPKAEKEALKSLVKKLPEKIIEVGKNTSPESKTIQQYSNEEIIAEIRRRHWTGKLTYPTEVEL